MGRHHSRSRTIARCIVNKGRAKLAAIGLVPIGLDVDEAAAYVGLTPRSFRAAVADGTYPPPIKGRGRKQIWNRLALETALGAQRTEHDQIMGAIDRAICAGRQTGR